MVAGWRACLGEVGGQVVFGAVDAALGEPGAVDVGVDVGVGTPHVHHPVRGAIHQRIRPQPLQRAQELRPEPRRRLLLGVGLHGVGGGGGGGLRQ
ncbi:hypothetical protein GCM10010428_45910 [Actinosynnema pretiosum subsp. pretiosum]